MSYSPTVNSGITPEGNKYHERKPKTKGKPYKLVQVNSSGQWYGYIGCVVQTHLPSEAEALKWLAQD